MIQARKKRKQLLTVVYSNYKLIQFIYDNYYFIDIDIISNLKYKFIYSVTERSSFVTNKLVITIKKI